MLAFRCKYRPAIKCNHQCMEIEIFMTIYYFKDLLDVNQTSYKNCCHGDLRLGKYTIDTSFMMIFVLRWFSSFNSALRAGRSWIRHRVVPHFADAVVHRRRRRCCERRRRTSASKRPTTRCRCKTIIWCQCDVTFNVIPFSCAEFTCNTPIFLKAG